MSAATGGGRRSAASRRRSGSAGSDRPSDCSFPVRFPQPPANRRAGARACPRPSFELHLPHGASGAAAVKDQEGDGLRGEPQHPWPWRAGRQHLQRYGSARRVAAGSRARRTSVAGTTRAGRRHASLLLGDRGWWGRGPASSVRLSRGVARSCPGLGRDPAVVGGVEAGAAVVRLTEFEGRTVAPAAAAQDWRTAVAHGSALISESKPLTERPLLNRRTARPALEGETSQSSRRAGSAERCAACVAPQER